MIVYLVILETPIGRAALEVRSTFGPDAASRRARMTACAIGWDLDEITVSDVSPLPH